MTSITVTQARANLFKLIDQTALSHEPIQITGRRQNGVLLSEDDFRAMQETVYLLSVPGMKTSLRKAKKAPVSKTVITRIWAEAEKAGVPAADYIAHRAGTEALVGKFVTGGWQDVLALGLFLLLGALLFRVASRTQAGVGR